MALVIQADPVAITTVAWYYTKESRETLAHYFPIVHAPRIRGTSGTKPRARGGGGKACSLREKLSFLLGSICTKKATARSRGDSPPLSLDLRFVFFLLR